MIYIKTKEKSLKNNIYSIDMLRLKVHCWDKDVQAFFNCFADNPDVEFWEDRRLKSYRYNWKFSFEVQGKVCGFWCGFCHNSEKGTQKHNLVIEYNPNKCDESPVLWSILKQFYSNYDIVEVVSFDVACDIPVNILDIVHTCDGKRKYRCEKNGGDDITHYYGVRGSDGFTKIYNKARELGLSDLNLTRYEVTRKVTVPFNLIEFITFDWSCLLELNVIEGYQYSLCLNGTERALLYAVMNGFPINDLPRVNKGKIKKILSESAGNTIDSICFGKAIKSFFTQLKDTIALM